MDWVNIPSDNIPIDNNMMTDISMMAGIYTLPDDSMSNIGLSW